MTVKPEWLYLDLMKKVLTFLLWDEPGISLEALEGWGPLSPVPQEMVHQLKQAQQALQPFGLQIVKSFNEPYAVRVEGRGAWPACADSMIGLRRMDNIQYCMEHVLENRIPGDFIETGAWRGGACIFMRAILAAYGIVDRRVFVADSFKGLPPPDVAKYPADQGDQHAAFPYLAVSREAVEARFNRYGLLDQQVVFLEGWFEDTLPVAPIDQLAVMRVDGDMYGSTMVALENLYPKLSNGGFCIVDDYALPGCRRAVDDFRAREGIQSQLNRVDWTGVFWQKVA
jgi:O-methyltransferase